MPEVLNGNPEWTARAMCRGSKRAKELLISTADTDKAQAYVRYCAYCMVREECTQYGKHAARDSGVMFGDHNRPKSVKKASLPNIEKAQRQRRRIAETEILGRSLSVEELKQAGYPLEDKEASESQPEVPGQLAIPRHKKPTKAERVAELKAEHPAAHPDADDWRGESACAQSDVPVENFFMPRTHKATQYALSLCVGCTFVTECDAWANALHAEYGVWAGELRLPKTHG